MAVLKETNEQMKFGRKQGAPNHTVRSLRLNDRTIFVESFFFSVVFRAAFDVSTIEGNKRTHMHSLAGPFFHSSTSYHKFIMRFFLLTLAATFVASTVTASDNVQAELLRAEHHIHVTAAADLPSDEAAINLGHYGHPPDECDDDDGRQSQRRCETECFASSYHL